VAGTGQTQYGDIGSRTAAWAATQMLRHAEPVLVLNKFGQSKPLPTNSTNTVKFRRPKVYGAISTPLQEGVTPTAQKFQYEDVTCVMKQWGGLFEISDQVADMSEDPVLSDAAVSAGEQAAATVEAVTYGVVRAGTNVFYANGTSRTSVNTPISLTKQRAVTRGLKAQKAMMIASVLGASANIQTKPIEAAFVAVCHTDAESDIRQMAGFTPTSQYGQRSMVHERELGSVEDVRYVTSPDLGSIADGGAAYAGSGSSMVTTSGTSADIYPVLYFGRESYGLVPLKGKSALTPTVVNPNKPDKSDPLGQRGYVGWKTYFNAVVLNELWMARLETAVSQL
jgi:N4-gp56 family major capsid protein